MRVYAYKVRRVSKKVPLLEDILNKINETKALSKREKAINKSLIRVESIKKLDNVWLLDFVRDRKNGGPGKAGRNKKVEGFSFEKGEFFAEETAALFIPETGYILIQYNQSGVKWQTIAKYFSLWCDDHGNNAYNFAHKLDDDFEQRYRNKTILRKVLVGIDLSKVKETDWSKGESLANAIKFGREFGDHHIKIEMSVGSDRSAKLRNAFDFIKNVLNLDKDAVKTLEVTGKDDNDSPSEVIDLIGQRLVADIDVKPNSNDLRLSLNSRWEALRRANNGWVDVLK